MLYKYFTVRTVKEKKKKTIKKETQAIKVGAKCKYFYRLKLLSTSGHFPLVRQKTNKNNKHGTQQSSIL